MKRSFKGSFLRGVFIFLLAVSSLIGLLEAALDKSRSEYFNVPPAITHIAPDALAVSWQTFPQFNKTTHYQVQLNHALYGSSTKLTRQTVTNLQPGATYKVSVVTYDNGSAVGVSSPTAVLMAPSAPTQIAAYDVGSASLSLGWQSVDTATGYRIYQSPDVLLKEVGADVTKIFLTGFTPGSLVTLRMKSVNATGESVFSHDIAVQLLPVAPPVTIVEDDIGQTWFSLKWQAQENALLYKIIVNDTEVASVPASVTEYRVEGLPAGTIVSVKMVVVNATGLSESSEALIVQLVPATPVLAVTAVSSYSCTLQWSVANGATFYKVYANNDWAINNVPSTITNLTITEDINPGMTATYTVRAGNDTGESLHSNPVVITYTQNSAIIREAGDLDTVLASACQFSDSQLSKNLRGKPLVWVYFPPLLAGPELALEVSYFDLLTRLPELGSVRFIGVFTGELVKIKHVRRGNLEWKRALANDKIRIPGNLPLVRFYSPDGVLRDMTRISMAIMTPYDVYKRLPETFEKDATMLQLYRESHDRFDSLHTTSTASN
ncbi:MAG: fibronectin type III domain-containing protein [Erysipelotrichia bacterium]|nr:fibronectin type III domain-containing protein [Erysipelotrichia bacterium]